MNIATLILAAGSSSRMNTCKQLLAVKDSTLLENALQQAKVSNSDAVYCVLGAHADEIQKRVDFNGVTIVINQNWNSGLSSSIVSGLQSFHLKSLDAILIMLADQPFVNADYLNVLIDEFKKHPNHIIASNYNKKLGVPAVFPKQYFKKLANLKGDAGAKELLNSNNNDVKSIQPKCSLLDIDTPDDYKKYISKFI